MGNMGKSCGELGVLDRPIPMAVNGGNQFDHKGHGSAQPAKVRFQK